MSEDIWSTRCDRCSQWAFGCELDGTARRNCINNNYISFKPKAEVKTKMGKIRERLNEKHIEELFLYVANNNKFEIETLYKLIQEILGLDDKQFKEKQTKIITGITDLWFEMMRKSKKVRKVLS